MPSGYSVPKNKACDVMDALEKAGVDYSIWNLYDFIDPEYNGKIDIECEDSRTDLFVQIIQDELKAVH